LGVGVFGNGNKNWVKFSPLMVLLSVVYTLIIEKRSDGEEDLNADSKPLR
jgi:hypothetical protein